MRFIEKNLGSLNPTLNMDITAILIIIYGIDSFGVIFLNDIIANHVQ